MPYCKNCGTKLDDNGNFCGKCGQKVKSSDIKESSTPQDTKHILPGILSFFIIGLGQFVKGQIKWGLTLWLWLILGNLLIGVFSTILGSFSIFLFVAFNLFLWIYQITDAYNSPELEQKED